MSTTTSGRERARANAGPTTSPSGRRDWLLVLLVFVAGAVSLAIEMAASRLLAPDFGSTLFVWASLIGLILLYLTVGYYLGGLLADRYPRPQLFYSLAIAAALLTALIPAIAPPVLNWALFTFSTLSSNVFYGSLVSVILLFALPMILLGCISPFAIRLRVERVGRSGRNAGLLYAISTAGSIVGTFLPVLVVMPAIGTAYTFLVFAGALLLVSVIGLFVSLRSKRGEVLEKSSTE